jgi:hypothetical protein
MISDREQAFARGLENFWNQFPEELHNAIETARQLSAQLPRPKGVTEEPLPPMLVGAGVERHSSLDRD